MRKKLLICLLTAAAAAMLVSGCAQDNSNIQISFVPAGTAEPAEAVPLPSDMTVHDTFFADLDSDGSEEKIIVGGIINEFGEEEVSINVFGGDSIIHEGVNWGYFTSAFLTRTQSGEVCVLISVDRGSEDYVTDIISLNGLEPISHDSVCGYVSKVSGTNITLEDYLDAIGSWYYYQEFLLTDSFDLKPGTDCMITMGGKEPLHTIKKLPVEMLVGGVYEEQLLDEDTYIYPVSTDCKSYMIFQLKDGSEGKINFSFKDYTLCIDGKNVSEYFDNAEYWD